jgi:hypothetical protein
MPGDKAYHLYIQRHLKVLTFGLLTLFAVIGFLITPGVFQPSFGSGPSRLIGLLWLFIID